MAVLLPNTRLGVVRRSRARDRHGSSVPGAAEPLRGPWPGRSSQAESPEVETGTWTLALDPQAWPVDDMTVVVEPHSGRSWTVVSADLLRHARVPLINYVRVRAHLRDADGDTYP